MCNSPNLSGAVSEALCSQTQSVSGSDIAASSGLPVYCRVFLVGNPFLLQMLRSFSGLWQKSQGPCPTAPLSELGNLAQNTTAHTVPYFSPYFRTGSVLLTVHPFWVTLVNCDVFGCATPYFPPSACSVHSVDPSRCAPDTPARSAAMCLA